MAADYEKLAKDLAEMIKTEPIEQGAVPLMKKVLIAMDKLGFEPAPHKLVEKAALDRAARLEKITLSVKAFVSELKHPKNIASMFPAEELALRVHKALNNGV